jgi:hypothetical protein
VKETDKKISNARYRPTYLDLKTPEHVTKATSATADRQSTDVALLVA